MSFVIIKINNSLPFHIDISPFPIFANREKWEICTIFRHVSPFSLQESSVKFRDTVKSLEAVYFISCLLISLRLKRYIDVIKNERNQQLAITPYKPPFPFILCPKNWRIIGKRNDIIVSSRNYRFLMKIESPFPAFCLKRECRNGPY